jgi:pyruvate kinase
MNTLPQHPSIIFTIGPSTEREDVLMSLLSQNVSYVRFNMSHATHDEHRVRLQSVRKVAQALNKDIQVFADLCGPKIRVRKIIGESMEILTDVSVRISYDEATVTGVSFSISFPELYQYVKQGTQIALDDGKILLTVDRVEEKDIVCKVVRGGVLLNEKGVNVIDTDLPIPSFTKKDEKDALFALSEGFDAVALSFVKRKEDILYLREFLKKHTEKNIPIIAKIETKSALHEMDGILSVVDMIMVARGDLGIELPIQKIPLIQKELLCVGKAAGVPVIVATEILKSMTQNPFPTRAEITDCIDALIDGASFLMLSDETTTGKYPSEAVTIMSSVIQEFIDNQKMYIPFER